MATTGIQPFHSFHSKNTNSWLFDTGIDSHIVNDKKWFLPGTMREVDVTLNTGGGKVNIGMMGTARLVVENPKGEPVEILLRDTLYSPGMDINLLSGLRFYQAGGFIHRNGTLINSEGKHLVKLDVPGHGFYIPIRIADIPKSVTPDTLYHALVSSSEKTVAAVESGALVTPDVVDKYKKDDPCKPCEVSKAVHFKLKDRRANKATSPGEVYHLDATIDYNANRLKRKPKRIQLDNGTDVQVAMYEKYCRDEGIRLRASPPYRYEQNGRIERMVRRVIVKMRTIMVAQQIPIELWPEIAKATAYLYNVTARADGTVPLVEWKRRAGDPDFKLDLSYLRALGCKCFFRKHDGLIQRQYITKMKCITDDEKQYHQSWPKGTWRKTKAITVTTDNDDVVVTAEEEITNSVRYRQPKPSTKEKLAEI
ncbi:Ribonuclease H-like protein [Niveomyces insectorum RCEF 264]|uniref:Ribonuclease H-like protein n=1 Tax=Niveomyces insectorum RCEF 264 TaxID=1081102 RepID=A0A162J6S2_9HYPO|nr:Ribonuclease H-like protein [Niveomyces insectorum RCEF 264]